MFFTWENKTDILTVKVMIKNLQYCFLGNVVLETFSYDNKMRLKEFFPKIGKWLTPIIKEKK